MGSVKRNERYHLWAKIGGEMQFISVLTTSDVYKKASEDGKRHYEVVDVFGYGWKGTVQAKKLRPKQEY